MTVRVACLINTSDNSTFLPYNGHRCRESKEALYGRASHHSGPTRLSGPRVAIAMSYFNVGVERNDQWVGIL